MRLQMKRITRYCTSLLFGRISFRCSQLTTKPMRG